jgi:hypothetical protein
MSPIGGKKIRQKPIKYHQLIWHLTLSFLLIKQFDCHLPPFGDDSQSDRTIFV